nr:hypothetical protein [Tanacetum cinerariifolium]
MRKPKRGNVDQVDVLVSTIQKGNYGTCKGFIDGYAYPWFICEGFMEASMIYLRRHHDEGTKILATVDGKLRTISESSIRRNLKLNDEEGINTLPDVELFENLTLSDLDTMSLDDLYNHLKVYEPEVQKKSESNSYNMAFISSAKNSSRKREVNTASIPTVSTQVSPASVNLAAASISHDTICLSQVEARLVEFKTHEIKFCENIRGLEFDFKNKNTTINNLMHELEQVKKDKEGLDSKLTGFQSSSNNLDNLLGSQRSNKNKEGLGYSVVPPPPSQVYSPPKKHISWTRLSEFADDTITDYSRPSPNIESN